MSKFGLGRGLADLEKEVEATSSIAILGGAQRVVVRNIPLSQIAPNPDQPRKTFTESELADLAASIKEQGVLQPILLRAVTGRPYLYEIVAGERRWRASKLAGLTEIPALVKTLTNENAMEIALIENVQRENLNPIEEAAAYKNLMEKCGYDIADVVRLIGKSESYIRNAMRITSLPDDVQKLVEDGAITASHARTIASAENPSAIAADIVLNKLSVADTTARMRKERRSASARAHVSTAIDDDAIREMTDALKASLGVDAKIIQRRGGAGQIVLSFKSRPQLNELIEKLS